ncbi:MAG: sulfatase [Pirellulales bacterium]|nr:sulfatase [Pirellulales bacterium]
MMRTCSLFLLVCLICGSLPAAERPEQPNVIIIFIDDMGFGDVGFNGATGPKTPNLDRMAAEGMQFRDFYVGCAVCSGSRTALLTGTHYQRLSMNPVLFPNSGQGLHPDEVTIADMLLEAGYATSCIGKWHLGHLPPCLPTYQGFESYYGIPYSNDMWIDPANTLAADLQLREGVTLEQVRAGHKLKNRVPLMRNEEVIEYPVDQSTVTKRYTEEAVRFITETKDRPFFLYLPHTMVHLPLAVSKAFENRTGELIWDAIEEVDWSVGEILRTLRETGIDDHTLVIFTSDNGAAVGSSLPLRAKKGSVYDGGIREPTVMRWPGQIPAGEICREVTASIDILPTLATLCGGTLPDRKIDGHDIWPLMHGEDGAVSPHEAYCLMHGPGTVRSGKWKYYPWPEGASDRKKAVAGNAGRNAGRPQVQLYDTVADISETTNLAAEHPEVVARLQAAWVAHNEELSAHRRPAADLIRPDGVPSPDRPTGDTPTKPLNWARVQQGRTYPTRQAPNLVRKPFVVSCEISGPSLEGVLVAHGGTVTGYSLSVHEGQVVFALRRDSDEISRVRATLPQKERFIVRATATENQLAVQIDEAEPATTASTGLLLKHPSEDFSVGFDERMPVDPQQPEGAFTGTVAKVRVLPLNTAN